MLFSAEVFYLAGRQVAREKNEREKKKVGISGILLHTHPIMAPRYSLGARWSISAHLVKPCSAAFQ